MSRLMVVTGATGRIGNEIVRQLGSHADFRILCVCRSQDRAEELIQKAGGGIASSSTVEYVLCDVSLQDEVKQLAANWSFGEIDVLMNSCAITPTQFEETTENIERQWATNALSYWWMIRYLGPGGRNLIRNGTGRIVNVASGYAGDLNLDDVEMRKSGYNVHTAYRASKQANRMMTYGLARSAAFVNSGITMNSVHPGIATSSVSLGLGFDMDRSQRAAENCARGPVQLAIEPELANLTGAYFNSTQQARCQFVGSPNLDADVAKLMDILQRKYTSE